VVWEGEYQGRAYEDRGAILDIEPYRLLRYTHFSRLSGLPDVPENYHTVTIRLTTQGGDTRVVLEQDNNESEEARDDSEGGWCTILNGLKLVVEG